jgi:hypothetical protein
MSFASNNRLCAIVRLNNTATLLIPQTDQISIRYRSDIDLDKCILSEVGNKRRSEYQKRREIRMAMGCTSGRSVMKFR